MSLTPEVVRQVAHLARLTLSNDQEQAMSQELANVLALAEQMNAVDTHDTQPLLNPLDSVQRLRSDVVTEFNQREQLQQGAPSVEAGLYLVPRVVE